MSEEQRDLGVDWGLSRSDMRGIVRPLRALKTKEDLAIDLVVNWKPLQGNIGLMGTWVSGVGRDGYHQ